MKRIFHLFFALALVAPTCCCWSGNSGASHADASESHCPGDGDGCGGENEPNSENGCEGCSPWIQQVRSQAKQFDSQAAKVGNEVPPYLFREFERTVYETAGTWMVATPDRRIRAPGDPPSLLQLYCVYRI